MSLIKNTQENTYSVLIKPNCEKLPVCLKKLILGLLKLSIAIGLLVLGTGYQSEQNAQKEPVQEYFKNEFTLALQNFFNNQESGQHIKYWNTSKELVKQFYEMKNYYPAWSFNFQPNSTYNQLYSLIYRAHEYGLNPYDYHIQKLSEFTDSLWEKGNIEEKLNARIHFEIMATDACMGFIQHLSKGMPDAFYYDSVYLYELNYLPSILMALLQINDNNLAQHILELQPDNIIYSNLQKALAKYVRSVTISDEEVIIPDPKKDMDNAKLLAFSSLVRLGYIKKDQIQNDTILITSLRKFQTHHGIKADGELTKRTISALQKSTLSKYYQAASTLNKLRKDQPFGPEFVIVNIPSFSLKVFHNYKVKQTHNVVVGKRITQTPEITSKIEEIVTYPYWNITPNIAKNEILPRIKKDSNFLKRNNIHVLNQFYQEIDVSSIDWNNITRENFSYYFRQKYSNKNALGKLKFRFPNDRRIYVHDTQSKSLFKRDYRAYSHGCIRLENPEQLATYILSRYHKTDKKLHKNLKECVHEKIKLDKPVKIYIRYYTCEADEEYNLYFYEDIYEKENSSKLLAYK